MLSTVKRKIISLCRQFNRQKPDFGPKNWFLSRRCRVRITTLPSWMVVTTLMVMVLPPERFAEIGEIDFHLHSFGNVATRFASVYLRGSSFRISRSAQASLDLLGHRGGLAARRAHGPVVAICGVRSSGFLANNEALVGSKIRYASSFTRSFTRNHANA